MKKLVLIMMASFTVFACSVDEDLALEEGALKKSNFSYSGEDCIGLAGEDNSLNLEYSDAESLESWDAVRNLYLSLLDPEVNTNGTFEPTIWEIIDQFHEQGLGDLTTTYTVANGDCSDSAVLTVNVVPDGQGDAACEVDAGADNSFTISESEANSLASWDEVRNLYLSILSPEAPTNGSFNPTISDIINSYTGVGEYATTYTVGEGDCTDSATLTLIVISDSQAGPACEANAGPDTSFTITESEANSLGSWDAVRNLYLEALSTEVPTNGSFNPTISDIINSYTGVGEYTTTYTVGEGDCTDSANLTLIVVPDGQECEGVNAGPDNSRTILESEAAAIGSWDEVRNMYLELLAPGVEHNGTFDPSISEIIQDFQARRSGNFTTTYTVTNGECSDSVELTVTVIPD